MVSVVDATFRYSNPQQYSLFRAQLECRCADHYRGLTICTVFTNICESLM